jgi:hypothetical protein
MVEDWERLTADYEGFDCTGKLGGTELWEELAIESYPTLLYQDPFWSWLHITMVQVIIKSLSEFAKIHKWNLAVPLEN